MFTNDTTQAQHVTNEEVLVNIALSSQMARAYRLNGQVQAALQFEGTMERLISEACSRGLDETHIDALAAATEGDLETTVHHVNG